LSKEPFFVPPHITKGSCRKTLKLPGWLILSMTPKYFFKKAPHFYEKTTVPVSTRAGCGFGAFGAGTVSKGRMSPFIFRPRFRTRFV